MQIVVSVLLPDPVNQVIPGPPGQGPGKRWVFSKNLVLERLDNNTPGNGLPQNPQQRLAGSYSGLVTTLRVAAANDPIYQAGSYLFQYEAIFKFNAVANTPLQAGQITARGVVSLAGNLNPIETRTFGITGGTGAYTTARGQISEQPAVPPLPAGTENWLLDIP
jgi:hypothetical protein